MRFVGFVRPRASSAAAELFPLWRALLFTLLAAALFRLSVEAAPPAGFESVDQEVSVRALPGTMAFDLGSFSVKPGSRVKLTLVNDDGMQHNLVVCAPGEGVAALVGQAALALGAEAVEKQFIPDSPEVLFYTRVVDPGESGTIYFQAPEEEGSYPYVCTLPGHWFTMKGVMQVSAAPSYLLQDLTFKYFAGRFDSVLEMDEEEPVKSGPVPRGHFDIEEYAPDPGEPFGLIFEGHVAVPHDGNYTFWVTSDDGVRLTIAGEVVAIDDGPHPPRQSLGKVHLTKGRHPLELRYFDSGGGRELQVSFSGRELPPASLTPAVEGRGDVEFFLVVEDEPRVVRALMPEASSRAIAVGLPDGANYCFDTADGSVRYGWWGGFLDIRPHMSGRGGQVCNLLGQRFEVGHVAFPLRIGSGDEPNVKFLGYRRGATPAFLYSVDGVEVMQTIEPAAQFSGLLYTFEISGHGERTVRFLVEPENLLLSSSAGEWVEGVLTVPAGEARHFTVTVQPASADLAEGGHAPANARHHH